MIWHVESGRKFNCGCNMEEEAVTEKWLLRVLILFFKYTKGLLDTLNYYGFSQVKLAGEYFSHVGIRQQV